MSTTSLFVELVVIGSGAAAWVGLLVAGAFGWAWVPVDRMLSPVAVVPVLSVVYVLGIVVDRIADALFQRQLMRLRGRWFASPHEYYRAQDFVYTRSQPLAHFYEYGRSRLRICRGWVVNSVLTAVSLDVFVWVRLPEDGRTKVAVLGTLGLLLLAIGCWIAWRRLAKAEAQRMLEQYRFLSAG